MYYNIGLVLEGGGMRGSYTSGVLDALLDEDIKFSYLIGVSAGASNGVSFVSEQRGRNKRVFVDYVKDKRYAGFRNLLREHSFFGMDFLYNQLPNKIEPFDYTTFNNSSVVFKVCLTDCETGKPVYFNNKDFESHYFVENVLKASSSLPLLSPMVKIKGRYYLDGGISNSIPVFKSIADGNNYNVIILTRNKEYRKKASRLRFITNIFLAKYPQLAKKISNRYNDYNDCLDKIAELEKENFAFVLRPQKKISVKRLEKDVSKLQALYEQGYQETMNKIVLLKKWLNKNNKD